MFDWELAWGVFFGVWLLLTAVYQFPQASQWIGRRDHFGLLPRWTFFAPNPGTSDHHIVYRECLDPAADLSSQERIEAASASLSPWRELADLCPGHHILFLWNPQRRVNKTISDLVNGFALLRKTSPDLPRYAHFTVEYFILLNLVQRGAPRSSRRQFAIVRSHGFGEARMLAPTLVSDFHPVDEP